MKVPSSSFYTILYLQVVPMVSYDAKSATCCLVASHLHVCVKQQQGHFCKLHTRGTSLLSSDSNKPVAEKASSPESEEAQDRADTVLKERIALTHGSHSPKTRRMQMRISYAETNGEGK